MIAIAIFLSQQKNICYKLLLSYSIIFSQFGDVNARDIESNLCCRRKPDDPKDTQKQVVFKIQARRGSSNRQCPHDPLSPGIAV